MSLDEGATKDEIFRYYFDSAIEDLIDGMDKNIDSYFNLPDSQRTIKGENKMKKLYDSMLKTLEKFD